MASRTIVNAALRELIAAELARDARQDEDPALDARVAHARRRYEEVRGRTRAAQPSTTP